MILLKSTVKKEIIERIYNYIDKDKKPDELLDHTFALLGVLVSLQLLNSEESMKLHEDIRRCYDHLYAK